MELEIFLLKAAKLQILLTTAILVIIKMPHLILIFLPFRIPVFFALLIFYEFEIIYLRLSLQTSVY